MALFAKKSIKTTRKKAAVPSDTTLTVAKSKDTLIYRTLIRPHVTEKAHTTLTLNKYIFRVAKTATKGAVKRAIEVAYGVHVSAVNIVHIPDRRRFFRGRKGVKSGFKKAIVTVRKGETIEMFQGA